MAKPYSRSLFTRTALNCNQDQLAIYLGVSRPLLANAESKRRQLPDEADILLLRLYEKLVLFTPAEPAVTDTDIAAARQQLLESLRAEMDREAKRMALVEQNWKDAEKALQAVAMLRAAFPKADARLLQFLKLLEAEANKTRLEFSAKQVAICRLKIQAWQAACDAITG